MMMLDQTKRFRVTIKTFYQYEKRFVLKSYNNDITHISYLQLWIV